MPDPDGDAPDWFYDAISERLEKVGGTNQWKDAYDKEGNRLYFHVEQWKYSSYRMAYAAVVWKALKAASDSRL